MPRSSSDKAAPMPPKDISAFAQEFGGNVRPSSNRCVSAGGEGTCDVQSDPIFADAAVPTGDLNRTTEDFELAEACSEL